MLNFIKEERIEVELFGFLLKLGGKNNKAVDEILSDTVKSLRVVAILVLFGV
jgi:hypothetical protein